MADNGWWRQELGEGTPFSVVMEVRDHVRQRIREHGEFSVTEWDHKSDDYVGVSSKRVTIAAHRLVSIPADGDKSMKLSWIECRQIILTLAIG